MKSSSLALLLVVASTGCTWQAVAVTPSATAGADPVTELTTILYTQSVLTPMSVEVTPQYIKETRSVGQTSVVRIADIAQVVILNSGKWYRVVAYDVRHHEIYLFDWRGHDLATCQRFVDAYDALTKHT